LAALAKIDPLAYGKSRNFLNGAITRLSPYIRHGVLTLAEVRDQALGRVSDPGQAEKLITELGFRDYFQRVYAQIGGGIYQEREAYKTGHPPAAYAQGLPADLAAGQTGLACMDGFISELYQTGYIHNHARMWLAAYLIHWRRVWWRSGADWFLEHLLDGDPASNHLSWQWVASTFSSKPYFFNRENLEKYTNGHYCRACPLADSGCPFDASYEALEAQLFPHKDKFQPPPAPKTAPPKAYRPAKAPPGPGLIWIHGEALSPQNPALLAYPDAPARFIFDEALLRDWRISLKRIGFIYECLLEMPLVIERGKVGRILIETCRAEGLSKIITTPSPSPRWAELCQELEAAGLGVEVLRVPGLLEGEGPYELKRFFHFWKRAQHQVPGS
jgi:deoxyribodipyrimidine photo-lyase